MELCALTVDCLISCNVCGCMPFKPSFGGLIYASVVLCLLIFNNYIRRQVTSTAFLQFLLFQILYVNHKSVHITKDVSSYSLIMHLQTHTEKYRLQAFFTDDSSLIILRAKYFRLWYPDMFNFCDMWSITKDSSRKFKQLRRYLLIKFFNITMFKKWFDMKAN